MIVVAAGRSGLLTGRVALPSLSLHSTPLTTSFSPWFPHTRFCFGIVKGNEVEVPAPDIKMLCITGCTEEKEREGRGIKRKRKHYSHLSIGESTVCLTAWPASTI